MPSANRRQPSPDMEQLENDIASEALPSDEEVADDLLEGELGDDEDGVIGMCSIDPFFLFQLNLCLLY